MNDQNRRISPPLCTEAPKVSRARRIGDGAEFLSRRRSPDDGPRGPETDQAPRQVIPSKKKYQKIKKNKKSLKIGTWNVQTMLDPDRKNEREDPDRTTELDEAKLHLLFNEMKRMNLNICGLCEVRWSKNGIFSGKAR